MIAHVAWKSRFLLLLFVGVSVQAKAETCSIQAQDLQLIRAQYICELSPHLQHCSQAMAVSGIMSDQKTLLLQANTIRQNQALLRVSSPEAFIEKAYSELLSEGLKETVPGISKKKISTLLRARPMPQETQLDANSALKRSAHEGLSHLVRESKSKDVPTEAAVFWIRQLDLQDQAIRSLMDDGWTRDQVQLLGAALTNRNEATLMIKELNLMGLTGQEQLSDTFWTQHNLEQIGRTLNKNNQKIAVIVGENLSRVYARESLARLGHRMILKIEDAGVDLIRHILQQDGLRSSILLYSKTKVSRFVRSRVIGMFLDNFKVPNNLAFLIAEYALGSTPTACATLDRAALPINEKCEITPEIKDHRHVLTFLDQYHLPGQRLTEQSKLILSFPKTCSYYQDQLRQVRQRLDAIQVQCAIDRLKIEMTYLGEPYQLDVGLSAKGIRQINALPKKLSASSKRMHVNLMFKSDGDEADSDKGQDQSFAGIVRMNALRGLADCRKAQDSK